MSAAEDGLCFGRLDLRTGERRHIGRIGLRDESGEGEPLLIDWRAPAARAFYVATAGAPHGVRRRRHIIMRGRRVTGLDDEVLDREELAGASGLTGEAALLAALEATRTGRMRDIVGTLQAEQDAIIRSAHSGILVVQGGPGTGKTAVALHRAAYLLYTHRRLAERGVLVVGPSTTFLGYISQVLPGLGETNVLMRTVGELFPGVAADRAEGRLAEEVKGRAVMAGVLAAAVGDRQAAGPAEIEFGGETLRLDRQVVETAARRARATRLPHNKARPLFQRQIIAALAGQYADRARELADRLEADVADVLAEAREAIEADLAGLPEIPGTPAAMSSRTWLRCGANCGRTPECGPGWTTCGPPSRRSGCLRTCSPTRRGSPSRRPRCRRPSAPRCCESPAAGAPPTYRCSMRRPSFSGGTTGPPARARRASRPSGSPTPRACWTSPPAPATPATRCSAPPTCWTPRNWPHAMRRQATGPWPSGPPPTAPGRSGT